MAQEQPGASALTQEDIAFENELRARHSNRKRIRRYDFPTRIADARSVYLFEINGHDEEAAALQADATMSSTARESFAGARRAEVRELMRLSIVGLIQEGTDGQVIRRVIGSESPLMEIDDWSTKAWAALRGFFADLNGLPDEELGEAIGAARDLRGPGNVVATRT